MDMKPDSDHTTKETILRTTLDLIKVSGCENITIRKIALAANVNTALINYHFGSKDKLLNEAMKIILNSLKENFLILEQDGLTPREKLTLFLKGYVSVLQQYPDLLRHVLTAGMFTMDAQFEFAFFIKMRFYGVLPVIAEITGEQDTEKLVMTFLQIVGAIVFPVMMRPLIGQVTDYKFPDPTQQVEAVVRAYLGQEVQN